MIPSTTGTVGNLKGYAMDLSGKKYIEIEGNGQKVIESKSGVALKTSVSCCKPIS